MRLLHDLLLDSNFWHHEAVDFRNTLIEVLRVVCIYVVGRFLINFAAKRVAEAAIAGPRRLGLMPHAAGQARLRTVIGLTRSVGLYLLLFLCGILLLRAMNVDAISVVTGASVAGIAFGLGAQKLFRDVTAGFFIILEDQYMIGDYVTINNLVSGRVEEMGMRILKMRDDAGRLVIFSNGDITQVTNQSRGAVGGSLDFGVQAGTDLGRMREIVDKAAKEIYEGEALGLTALPKLIGVVGGDSTRTTIRIGLQVDKPQQLLAASQAIHDAVYAGLLSAGITPFG